MARLADSDALRRLVDDGAPLVLSAGSDDSHSLVVFTSICVNPECDCTVVGLQAALVPTSPGKRLAPETDRRAVASVDVRTGAFVPQEPPDGQEQDEHVLHLLEDAVDEVMVRFLFERRLRARGQYDRDQWRRQAPAVLEADHLVAYCEVFPRDFDLCVVAGGRRLWVVDQYCLQPGCTCRETCLDFDDTVTGELLGRVRVEPGRWRRAELEGPAELRPAWKALLAQPDAKALLMERSLEMKRVGREMAAERGARAPAPVKTGRNAPCPCGSGKKHKRCCLPRAEGRRR